MPDNRSFRDAAAAILVLHDRRYLSSCAYTRSLLSGPLGLFGGALEPEENAEAALRRELKEELDYSPEAPSYFTSLKFDFERLGASRCVRLFYEVQLPLHKACRLDTCRGPLEGSIGDRGSPPKQASGSLRFFRHLDAQCTSPANTLRVDKRTSGMRTPTQAGIPRPRCPSPW